MGALPKRKISRTRRDERRSHLGLTIPNLSECQQCHSPKLPYHVCPTCGTYDGREVVKVKSRQKRTPSL